jgi:HEPN/RES N-terminal domain 1/RES domain
MGRAKDWEMEQEERGWWSVPGKYVCAECFEEDFLREFVRNHAEVSKCDYCGSTAEDLTGDENALIAAPLDTVLEIIAEGLRSEWNDANSENIPYESAEGGYQADTQDTYDLVWDYVDPTNEEIAEAIINALPDHAWVERDYWALDEGQQLLYGWKDFCDLVKHKNRYMFHLRPRRPPHATPAVSQDGSSSQGPQKPIQPPGSTSEDTPAPSEGLGSAPAAHPDLNDLHLTPESIAEIMGTDLDEMMDERQEGVSASRMLEAIGDVVDELGLVKEMPAHMHFFRGRIGSSGKPYRTARKLGPPPERKAVANRMSPAGIAMFYGAADEYGAIAETVFGRLPKGKILNVGVFETTENMHVLDLTNVPGIPSLFSPSRHLRPILRFLRSFIIDLSKPIKKDDRVHTEYVPTQIVTEYFRHSFHRDSGPVVRGILYPSSRAKGHTACVLFFTRDECGAPDTSEFAEEKRQWLRFVPRSANVFRRKPRKPKQPPAHVFPTGLEPSSAGQMTLNM